MSGVRVFKSLADALSRGFQIYESKPDGSYIVRILVRNGAAKSTWQMAIVEPERPSK